MGIQFRGGQRFQRGRGIGGLLRMAKSLFKPVLNTVGKVLKSNTGKAIGHAIKEQAIETGTNLLTDAIKGNNMQEGLKREQNNIKARAAKEIEELKNRRKREEYWSGEEPRNLAIQNVKKSHKKKVYWTREEPRIRTSKRKMKKKNVYSDDEEYYSD